MKRPLYMHALRALQSAHNACFKHPERDVLGMSNGPFSGVNEVLGIVSELERENMLLAAVLSEDESGTMKASITYTTLVGWKMRRKDKRVEQHWAKIKSQRPLSSYEEYQRDWNFIESEYGDRPSNNGLDTANPSFAYMSHLAKDLVARSWSRSSQVERA